MRLAISNIAWDTHEDHKVAQILNQFRVDAIDIAPGKYFSDFHATTREDVRRVRQWWQERGIEITGMQALLFGTNGLNVFGSQDVQNRLLHHLKAVCRIGTELGATRLVFGSPKNRDRTGLSDQDAMCMAIEFFRRLGDIAKFYGVLICLEPNPPCYGANFMTTTKETAAVVMNVAHASIKMQLDTGALSLNGEDPKLTVETYHPLIGHIHASEPNLVPLGDSDMDHTRIAHLISRLLPNHVISIEMLSTQDESHISSIERALKYAIQHYSRNAHFDKKIL